MEMARALIRARVFLGDERAATERQNLLVLLVHQPGDDLALAPTKFLLADLCENVADRGAGGVLNCPIRILERPAQRLGQTASDGCLAGAHHAHQHHGAVEAPADGVRGGSWFAGRIGTFVQVEDTYAVETGR